MSFKTLLCYLPAADFTQPHPAIPYLAGYLRNKGEHVVARDLNMEAFLYILSREYLKKCHEKVKNRFISLDKKGAINLIEQKEYTDCLEALGVNRRVLSGIEEIKRGFRSKAFFDYKKYKRNVDLLNQALALVSAAHYPSRIEGAEYFTPFFLRSDHDIMEQTDRAFNPFVEFYEKDFFPFIEKEQPDLIGMSVTYPSQALQMFALAHRIKERFPRIHLCAGGAFLCRMVLNMKRAKFKTLFECLDSVIVYEGETALFNLVSHLKENGPGAPASIQNAIFYDEKKDAVLFPPGEAFVEDPDETPPPDFDGFPLEDYLSPKPVLPYAPTRGCYWNKCAFCHYGATREGTAVYRERSVKKIVEDLELLSGKYNVNHFAFSVDIISPSLARGVADEMIQRELSLQWNTDIRFEESYTEDLCRRLKKGGCRSVAIGLESGCGRILDLIEKGITIPAAERVARNFSNAGIGVQVMSFLNFPTETGDEALETIDFVSRNKAYISLFTMGDYELLYGSKVFRQPEKYGLKRVYYPKGDDFKILCLYDEEKQSKTDMDSNTVDSAFIRIAEEYSENENPFAGGVSTNHTFLYLEKFGKDVFKRLAMNTSLEKKKSKRKFKNAAKPRLHPDVRIMEGNFSTREANENLEANAPRMKEFMFKGGKSARRAMNDLVDRKTIPARHSLYFRIDDMKWIETPSQVKEFMDLCNGKNTFKRITKSQGKIHRDSVKHMLNELLSLNILAE